MVSPERYWRACEACTTAGKRAQLLRNVHNISETCTTSLKRAHLECLKTHGGAVKHAIPIYTYHDVYIYICIYIYVYIYICIYIYMYIYICIYIYVYIYIHIHMIIHDFKDVFTCSFWMDNYG